MSQNQNNNPTQEAKTEEKPKLEFAKKAIVKSGDPRLKKVADLKTTALIVVEAVEFDAKTRKRLSVSSCNTYNEKDWIQFRNFHQAYGLSVIEIVNLPKGWWLPPIFKEEE